MGSSRLVNAGALLQEGIAFHQAGDLGSAELRYREALQRQPDEATALALLGALCAATGRAADAALLLRRAVGVRPDWAEAREQFGLALLAAGDGEAAIAELERATVLGPHLPSTFYNLANALRDSGRPEAAIQCYLRSIELAPDFVEALVNLGSLLIGMKRPADAEPYLRRAVALRPYDAGAVRTLGIALRGMGDLGGAESAFRSAIHLAAGDPDGWTELGGLLREEWRCEEAAQCYRRARDLRPSFAPHHLNLGLALEDLGAFEEALSCYEQALRLDAGYADARLNRTIVRLTLGEWPDAWPVEGWNALVRGEPPRGFDRPRWDGQNAEGKRILVCAEQGYGDTIQFVRYLPMVRALGAYVVFECQPALVDLIGGCDLADEVIPMRADRRVDVEFDAHIELMTLPALFRTTTATVPRSTPYIRVPFGLVEQWRRRIPAEPVLRVALVWSGNPNHRNDRNRSMTLSHLAPLFSLEGVRFYSLQKGPAEAALRAADLPVVDLGPDLNDFSDTAAALLAMDLALTVDTSVAHLAGALGVAAWTMIPRVPDWRWLLDRSDTPWYPTMRLYRQPAQGDWASVVARVCTDLRALASARAA